NPDVEVNDAVVVDVDLPVVIEIPVGPAGHTEADVEVDLAVVVDVDLAVQIGVAAVRVHHQGIAACDGPSGPHGGIARAGQVLRLLTGGDADGGEAAAGGVGLGGDDAAGAV